LKTPKIDTEFLLSTLKEMISIPSPTGYTDQIVRYTCRSLEKMGIGFEMTRRGAIRANLKGRQANPGRAIVAHLDTLGAMTKSLKDNGRLQIVPIGTWSSRFAEGARVTIFCDDGVKRGSILPLKSSGHTYNKEIDTLPISWDTVEVRVDSPVFNKATLQSAGYKIGDFIAIDPVFEIIDDKYISSRHLDNKAGVATLLAAAKYLSDSKADLPLDCHLLFTISEEVGSGASAVLHGDVSEMVSIDNSTVAPGQNSTEAGVTVCMKDSTGPFDYHLTHKLLGLCESNGIQHERDVFRWYRCDAASAIEAGNDIRTALVCFGCDSSHGYERTHIESLEALAKLVALYCQSEPTASRDKDELSTTLKGFTTQTEI